MQKNYSVLVLALLFAGAGNATANSGNLEKAAPLFASAWTEDYRPTECGDNTLRLLKRLRAGQVRTDGAEVIAILPRYDGALVNAERARPERGEATGEQNWFYHVFLILDGSVLDLDFMTRPTILRAADYFDRMFLSEINPPFYRHNLVGRAEKLAYEVEVYSAEEYLAEGRRRVPHTRMTLGEYLNRL